MSDPFPLRDCTCLSYGHGLSLTVVPNKTGNCPVHGDDQEEEEDPRMSDDLVTELLIISDVVFRAVSVLGRLAKETGHPDLAVELEELLSRTVEVIELEQLRNRS